MMIVERSENPYLAPMMNLIMPTIRRLQMVAYLPEGYQAEESVAQHMALIDVLERGEHPRGGAAAAGPPDLVPGELSQYPHPAVTNCQAARPGLWPGRVLLPRARPEPVYQLRTSGGRTPFSCSFSVKKG